MFKKFTFDRVLGKKVVSSIPWKKAYTTLMPKLQILGVKKASLESVNTIINKTIKIKTA